MLFQVYAGGSQLIMQVNSIFFILFYFFIFLLLYLAVLIISGKMFYTECQNRKERKEEENSISEMRYLNRLRLKQDSLVIERKETGKSLYDFAMVVLSLMSLHGLSLKTSLRGYLLLTLMNKLLTKPGTELLIRNRIILVFSE